MPKVRHHGRPVRGMFVDYCIDVDGDYLRDTLHLDEVFTVGDGYRVFKFSDGVMSVNVMEEVIRKVLDAFPQPPTPYPGFNGPSADPLWLSHRRMVA